MENPPTFSTPGMKKSTLSKRARYILLEYIYPLKCYSNPLNSSDMEEPEAKPRGGFHFVILGHPVLIRTYFYFSLR